MEIKISNIVIISVFCEKCGNKLEAYYREYDRDIKLFVVPCKQCTEDNKKN